MDETTVYRNLIDAMVRACRSGQGQIGAERARRGVWNPHAGSINDPALADDRADQLAMNALLARLDLTERQVLARTLEQEFINGVHEALVILHEAELPPFDKAYEGTPFHDFVGRLDGWGWPSSRERTS